jgi:hypothetical protein
LQTEVVAEFYFSRGEMFLAGKEKERTVDSRRRRRKSRERLSATNEYFMSLQKENQDPLRGCPFSSLSYRRNSSILMIFRG